MGICFFHSMVCLWYRGHPCCGIFRRRRRHKTLDVSSSSSAIPPPTEFPYPYISKDLVCIPEDLYGKPSSSSSSSLAIFAHTWRSSHGHGGERRKKGGKVAYRSKEGSLSLTRSDHAKKVGGHPPPPPPLLLLLLLPPSHGNPKHVVWLLFSLPPLIRAMHDLLLQRYWGEKKHKAYLSFLPNFKR